MSDFRATLVAAEYKRQGIVAGDEYYMLMSIAKFCDEGDTLYETDAEFWQLVPSMPGGPLSASKALDNLIARGIVEEIEAEGGYRITPLAGGAA